MRSFLMISSVLGLLSPLHAGASINQLIDAKKVSDLRIARATQQERQLNRQICANQVRFNRAPLNCAAEVIESKCREPFSGWLEKDFKVAIKNRSLTKNCREQLRSALELRVYQSEDL